MIGNVVDSIFITDQNYQDMIYFLLTSRKNYTLTQLASINFNHTFSRMLWEKIMAIRDKKK